MYQIDLLEEEKELLYKELKITSASTRKDEIIDRILEIEQELLRLSWETVIPSGDNFTTCYLLS